MKHHDLDFLIGSALSLSLGPTLRSVKDLRGFTNDILESLDCDPSLGESHLDLHGIRFAIPMLGITIKSRYHGGLDIAKKAYETSIKM